MRKNDEIKKDIQLKCPELTDEVLALLTEYLIVQISNIIEKDSISLTSVVSDGKHYSSMMQKDDGIGFILD